MNTIEEVKEIIKDRSPLKLTLACGGFKDEGFLGVDISPDCGAVDIVCDLLQPTWPFEDNSVDEIHCQHFFEHIEEPFAFMDECYRILKPNAKMVVIAPYYTSVRAWQDPTHKKAISEASFLYYNKGYRENNKLEHYGIKSDFDFSYGYNWTPEWTSRSAESQAFAVAHYFNVVSDIVVHLTKRG